MLRRIALFSAVLLAVIAASAVAVQNPSCPVNASAGFANCVSASNPSAETVKAWHASGLPYKWQLYRPSDGGKWGAWTYSDQSPHVVNISLSGSITGQVDNLGSGNPSAYLTDLQ